jgi:hypothetical protein
MWICYQIILRNRKYPWNVTLATSSTWLHTESKRKNTAYRILYHIVGLYFCWSLQWARLFTMTMFQVLVTWVKLSWVYLTADGQSTSSSWYRAPLWGPWQDFILILYLVTTVLPVGRPLWREDGSVTYNADWSGHWGPITIHYRLIWDCVPSSSPLTTRRDYDGGIVTRLQTGILVTMLIWAFFKYSRSVSYSLHVDFFMTVIRHLLKTIASQVQ